jgi:FkbM family methyltransferase
MAMPPALFPIGELLGDALPQLVVIDVGALSHGDAIYAPLMAQGLCRVVGFEPARGACEKLRAEHGEPHIFLPHVIGDGSDGTLRLTRSPLTSSLYEPNRPLLEAFQQLGDLCEVVERLEVQTHRLDEIPEARGATFLKLDVQGAELDVINGATEVLSSALVVQTEVEFLPLYEGQPLFADVDIALRARGFVLHRLTGAGSRAFAPMLVDGDPNRGLNQWLWSDAIYVRDFLNLDALELSQLLQAAAILHTCYGSYDLVHRFLAAHDARAPGLYAPRYLNRLQSGLDGA